MSKRALKNYLNELTKPQLEAQILDLYQRFKEVKTFYDFSFNPREEKLINEARFKINKEYFPLGRRKPKARMSVAQKYFKHFMQIGLEASLLADLMLFNIETAQQFNRGKPQKADAFFKSMANSYEQAVDFIVANGLQRDFQTRLTNIAVETEKQGWYNLDFFQVKRTELEDHK